MEPTREALALELEVLEKASLALEETHQNLKNQIRERRFAQLSNIELTIADFSWEIIIDYDSITLHGDPLKTPNADRWRELISKMKAGYWPISFLKTYGFLNASWTDPVGHIRLDIDDPKNKEAVAGLIKAITSAGKWGAAQQEIKQIKEAIKSGIAAIKEITDKQQQYENLLRYITGMNSLRDNLHAIVDSVSDNF